MQNPKEKVALITGGGSGIGRALAKQLADNLYQVWSEELASRGVLAGFVQPGVVDTEMQDMLRSDKEFINRSFFSSLKTETKLASPNEIARVLSWILLTIEQEQFVEKDW